MTEFEPFVIRGHHIEHFAVALEGRLAKFVECGIVKPEEDIHVTPEQAAIDMVIGAKTLDKEVYGKLYSKLYQVDVLGLTAKSVDRAMDRTRRLYEKFVTLDPEHPIRLTVKDRDEICKACAIGAHCFQPLLNIHLLDGDVANLQHFVKQATILDNYFESDFKIPDGVEFPQLAPDDHSWYSANITAPAGYVKEVFKQWWSIFLTDLIDLSENAQSVTI